MNKLIFEQNNTTTYLKKRANSKVRGTQLPRHRIPDTRIDPPRTQDCQCRLVFSNGILVLGQLGPAELVENGLVPGNAEDVAGNPAEPTLVGVQESYVGRVTDALKQSYTLMS